MRAAIPFILSLLPVAAMADVPHVITDIPPIHALTAQVMGDLGMPILLLDSGADEHDFQLRPSQMGDISSADLVVWVGPELTPWLERAMAGATAQSLPLLDQSGTHVIGYADAAHKETAVDTEGHDHSGENPHAWMDPKNASAWVDVIAKSLADLDPENSAVYAKNAAIAKARIAAMDGEIAAALAPIKDKAFVTYHDAYGYFVAHYGLTYAGAIAAGDAAPAGAAHIQELQAKIADGVVCVFPEAQHDGALLLQLLDGTAARQGASLDPVGSTIPAGADAYDTLMRGISKSLLDCLTGA